ncbi:unnamed protein product [Euphydryas editha]|uniref:Uncharacterized protein n=1 Tax=Euphydryas editha TaxID=104508 RepID=A0AAU9UTS8_EUPED|nr:unnamed protein product [Euphydryas editha]
MYCRDKDADEYRRDLVNESASESARLQTGQRARGSRLKSRCAWRRSKRAVICRRTFSGSRSSRDSAGDAGESRDEDAAVSRDVAGTLAVGMDRWQTTLEDMMHLRSSNNQTFKDNYWYNL